MSQWTGRHPKHEMDVFICLLDRRYARMQGGSVAVIKVQQSYHEKKAYKGKEVLTIERAKIEHSRLASVFL